MRSVSGPISEDRPESDEREENDDQEDLHVAVESDVNTEYKLNLDDSNVEEL